EDLRAEQRAANRAANNTATQAIDALKSEVKSLRQRLEGLEQRLPPMEAHLQDSPNLRAAEREIKEQIQQIQEVSRAHQQAADNIERLRKSMHLRVEDMRGELK